MRGGQRLTSARRLSAFPGTCNQREVRPPWPRDVSSLALTPELVYRAIGRHSLGPAREEVMSSRDNYSEDAKLHGKDAAQRARPWMERLARLGYATEGAVYALIGLLAAGAA